MSTAATAITSSQALPPGDLPADTPSGKKVSGLDIRELNDLIRKRYALDIEIWAGRDSMASDRHLVKADMVRSDVVLAKIMMTVQLWDNPLLWESKSDLEKLQMIDELIALQMERTRLFDIIGSLEKVENIAGR